MINYAPLQDFLHSQHRRWGAFVCYLSLPPLLGIVLALGTAQKLRLGSSEQYLAATMVWGISSLPYIRGCYQSRRFTAAMMSYILVIALIGTLCLTFAFVGQLFDLSMLVPNPVTLLDSLWAGLITAIILASYFHFTNISANEQPSHDELPIQGFIDAHARRILIRYGDVIDLTASRHSLPKELITAILVYEDLNRPRWVRWLESALVSVLPLSMTIGIAQVRSDRPLTDDESIILMGSLLAALHTEHDLTNEPNDYRRLLEEYNGGNHYADEVLLIFERIVESS